jgi:nitrogen fixation NifU-like protein
VGQGQVARRGADDQEHPLPPVKIHCSILAEDAIKAAVSDYKAKSGQVAGQAH